MGSLYKSLAKIRRKSETAKKKAQKLTDNGYIIESSASGTDCIFFGVQ